VGRACVTRGGGPILVTRWSSSRVRRERLKDKKAKPVLHPTSSIQCSSFALSLVYFILLSSDSNSLSSPKHTISRKGEVRCVSSSKESSRKYV
jgi:hypothetical protein